MDEYQSELIRENRKIGQLPSYSGICENCGSPVTISDPLVVVEVERDEKRILVVPVDKFQCRSCKTYIQIIRIWIDLEVSDELRKAGTNACR